MAATYGYGGEFSSDEDIDKIEQQTERLNQSKFDNYAQIKPTKRQIEEAIETIRKMPLEQDVTIPDELLAGLLDHYKTQRGPIVDSTRNLYKKIVLRLVRGEQQQKLASNGESVNDANGNNNNAVINKKQPKDADFIGGSSDEDEPMPPVSSQGSDVSNRKRFDSRVVNRERIEPMEIDSEVPTGPIRANKAVDITTEESSSDSEESSDETTDSEVLDITPIKSASQTSQTPQTSTPIVPKAMIDFASRRQISSVTKTAEEVKKPYRRSQRVAATKSSSSTSKVQKTDVSSSKSEPLSTSDSKTLSKSALANLISRNQLTASCQEG